MKNIKSFINNKLSKAVSLKEQFKVLEKKDWDSLTVLLELNIQLSHLYNVFTSSDAINEEGRVFDNLGDEISDVLLQLSYLSYLEKIDFSTLDNYQNYTYDKIEGLSILFGQLTEVFLEDYEYRFVKSRPGFNTHKDFITDRIIKMFLIVSNLADKYNIDILNEFDTMYEDATNFIKKSVEEQNGIN